MLKYKKGFALIEILLSVTIFSMIVVGLYSSVARGSFSIARNRKLTKAILIARSHLIEFKNNRMRGADINEEPVEDQPGFFLSRVNNKYELPGFEIIPLKRVLITVSWQEGNQKVKYDLSYIYSLMSGL